MKKTIIFLFLLILLVPIVSSEGYMEGVSIGQGDNRWCRLIGCTIVDLIVDSLIVYNLSVIGQVFNVTMNLVTWNITESFNVGGNLVANNITATGNYFGNISETTGEHWVNESGDTMTGKLNVEVSSGGAATIGGSNSAIGDYAVAMGDNTNAIGLTSTAMGWSTTANETASTAMGLDTTASGGGSIAMGYDTAASGTASTAMGRDTTASGDYSTAMGFNTTASGHYSTAMGYNTTASTWYSTALGIDTIASGGTSIAMGWGTIASGNHSTAIGRRIEAFAPYTVGIGLDDIYRNITQPHTMSIMGGNVGIGTTSPTYKLEVVGDTNIIGNLTVEGITNITHSLQDAYDDGSVIQMDNTDVYFSVEDENDFIVTSECLEERCSIPEGWEEGDILSISQSIIDAGTDYSERNITISVTNFDINSFVDIVGGSSYINFFNALTIATKATYNPHVFSQNWYPFEDATYDLGCAAGVGPCGEDLRWRDLYLSGTVRGPNSSEPTIFMNANVGSGDVRFGYGNFNVTNNGTVVTSKNITTHKSLIVDNRIYLSENSYMEADANGNIDVW